MVLDCILDDCPKGGMVDHRKCCGCKFNPLSDGQPEIGKQNCQHPQAKHDPKPERWSAIKASVSTAHLLLCGKSRT